METNESVGRTGRTAPRTDRYHEIRTSLASRSGSLAKRVEALECHLAERRGLARSESEVAPVVAELLAGAREELALIDSALRRMDRHEYDCCMTCGSDISLRQLEAFPYAVNCTRCAHSYPLDYTQGLRMQHKQLRQFLGALEDLIGRVLSSALREEAPGAALAATLLVLRDLDRELPDHFGLEERGGIIADAASLDPRLRRRAAALMAQHRDFCERSRRILRIAEDGAASPEAWQRIEEFFGELARDLLAHEAAESVLFQSALSDDFGASA